MIWSVRATSASTITGSALKASSCPFMRPEARRASTVLAASSPRSNGSTVSWGLAGLVIIFCGYVIFKQRELNRVRKALVADELELQDSRTRLSEISALLKPTVLPGDILLLRITCEGREKGQGVAYLADGTMVVVNGAHSLVGQQVQAHVQALHQTGAGVIVFADLKLATAA